MIATGTCPKCENTVSYVSGEHVEVRIGLGGPKWNGISYKCPSCNTILGTSLDPVALKTDTVDEVIERLGR